jgi:hypothetical protein
MEPLAFAKTRQAHASPKRLNQSTVRKSTAHTQKKKKHHCEIGLTLTGCSVHCSGRIPGKKIAMKSLAGKKCRVFFFARSFNEVGKTRKRRTKIEK